jgi:aspartate aminotransferase
MRLADRMACLGGEGMGSMLAQVARLKAEGRRIIPLHAGEPDFDTPGEIVESAVQALRRGETHYAPAAGLPNLRKAIAEHIAESRSISVEPDQVVVTPGAKPMIYYTILALCQSGDEVICPDPSYPFYAAIARFVGAKAVSIPMTMERGFRLDTDSLGELITDRTRLIVLNSPSNPTGGVLHRADLEAIAELVQERDIFVLSDEIYSRIIYDGAHFESIVSVPGMADRTVIIDGHSKTYAMTGWRLGYGVMPKWLAPPMSQIVLNTVSCSTTFAQIAGTDALTGSQESVNHMVETFQKRRNRIVQGLNQIPGVRCLAPEGAFYAFPKIEGVGMSSRELSDHLLAVAGVATYPGSAFGQQGEGFLRLSFACSEADINEGLSRIGDTLGLLRDSPTRNP